MSPIRVFIVDDNSSPGAVCAVFLKAEDDITDCGEASSGMEALKRLRECPRTWLLMDIRHAGHRRHRSHRELLREKADRAHTHGDGDRRSLGAYERHARPAPGVTWFTGILPPESALDAIRSVASGQRVMSRPIPVDVGILQGRC